MGFFNFKQKKKGFTLIEVLVAVAILGLLASIVYFNGGEARKKAHDTQRVSDLEQVQLAVRSYRDLMSTTTLPAANPAEIVGDGVGFDTTIAPYVTATIKDPLNTGTNQYYYRSAYTCGGSPHTIIVALTMENSSNGNFASVCGAGPYAAITAGVTPTAASYVIVLQ